MNKKIGVLDSGVGALTVARELQKKLPHEDIIYFGDNGNVPYGNKEEEEIHRLTKRMVDFLIEEDVKLIAIACNTISTLVDKYFSDYPVPIISIIDPVAKCVADKGLDEVGVLATNFTINSGEYDKKINATSKKPVKIVSEGSATLAALVDSGDYSREEAKEIIKGHLDNMRSKSDILKYVILGCTHYPILEDIFEEVAPDLEFINPAEEQVKYIGELLEKENCKKEEGCGEFDLYTTGKRETYDKMIEMLEMHKPEQITVLAK